jgi:hypothetical protein
MKKSLIKKIALSAGAVFLLLVVVLCVHIYIVTRPKPMDAHTVAMARIDIKQPINQEDADRITTWLYQQNGIDHVLCNPSTRIVVFTYHPIVTTANDIVQHFKSDFNYAASRYIPSDKEMRSGCPVATTSITYKIFGFFRHI